MQHTLIIFFGAVIGMYFALRGNTELMNRLCSTIARPYHRFMSTLCDKLSFSVAEVLIYALIVLIIVYITLRAVKIAREKHIAKSVYITLTTLLTAAAAIYAGFCLLWGTYYYSESFAQRENLSDDPISVQQLQAVTEYFAEQANYYSSMVQRDESGVYCTPEEEIFRKAPELYDNISKEFKSLNSVYIKTKSFEISKVLSLVDFTGFFFPFTGEANVNTDSPRCYLPSTIAHEISHQRGVAQEQQANFVAVVACMEYGDADYCYSAALLAYVHLGNALYKADYDAWKTIYESLDGNVLADFAYNREYWAKYESPIKSVSNTVYEGFLKSNGQSLGLQSYGDCVDLLVNYYYDEAAR